MKLYYPGEHTSCFIYENGDAAIINKETLLLGDVFNISTKTNQIVFVLEGDIIYLYGNLEHKKIKAGHMLMFPARSDVKMHINSNTTLIILHLNMTLAFCDHFSFDMLLKEKKPVKGEKGILKSNERIVEFMVALNSYISDGLKCFYFFELKIKEFLFLLRAYYSKEDLYLFFSQVISSDLHFSDQVFENYEKVKTVKDLAEALNYSVSGFEKKFRKVFGISASKWMKNQKSRIIYHEITCTKKTFSELSFDFGFSSPSYFNDYCKVTFGDTPGNIRKNGIFKPSL